MNRHLVLPALAVIIFVLGQSIGHAQVDPNFAADLLAANISKNYSHIINERERVYIYRLHKNSQLFRQCDKRFTGVLECSVKEMAEIEAQRSAKPEKARAKYSQVASLQKGVAASAAAPSADQPPTPNTSAWYPFLRHDIPDISLFGPLAKPTRTATGATISYSNDRVANNNTWAINGIAGVAYQFYGNYSPGPEPYILGAYLAPYVSVNRIGNSNQVSKNVDTISPGAKIQVGVDQLWGGQQYFRVGGAAVIDQIADTTAISATFEWIPVYERFIHFPGTIGGLIAYRFDPELMVQFDSTTNSKKPLLFSGRDQALRIGPLLSLNLQLVDRDIPIISKLFANITYHWAEELYSARSLSWFQAALTYNIDPNGYLGFTGSYKNGSDENTGRHIDLYQISLSGKY